MLRRTFLSASAALAASAAAPSFAANPRVVVGYTLVPDFSGAFIAKEQGFFEKRGLDVEMQPITLTSNIPAALVSNSIQIGGTTPPVFLQAADSGLDLVGLASGATYDPKRNLIGIVARAGSNIQTAKDLVGRKFAVPGLNGTLHVLVRRWLMVKGVDPKQVSFVEVPLPQIPDVLKGGSVDAAVTGEPFIARIKGSGIGDVIPGFDDEMPGGFATVVYTANRSWAAANAAALKAFREALGDAIAFASQNRAAALADLGKYMKLPPPVLQATPWPDLTSNMSEAHLNFWVDTMNQQGMLKKAPAVAGLIAR